MDAIKSFTDVEQSKKLAKILPLESADYTRLGKDESNVLTRTYFESCSSELKGWIGKDEMYPCWSLAALLDIIPSGQVNRVIDSNKWESSSWNNTDFEPMLSVGDYDNSVDACVTIIEKLHEIKIL